MNKYKHFVLGIKEYIINALGKRTNVILKAKEIKTK